MQLVLVWNSTASNAEPGSTTGSRLDALASRLWQLAGEPGQQRRDTGSSGAAGASDGTGASASAGLLHSVWANFQPARTNTILGPEWRLLRGEEAAWAQLGGAQVCFAPGSFLQASRTEEG